MRLLNTKFEFCDFDDSPPPYAILSHTWSEKNEEEVTYQDLKSGTAKSLLKLELCRDWTKAANLEYFWIDTCCIDKRNDAEIGYAIRSMWRWYCEARICFVYLPDLSKKRKLDTDWRDSLKDCRWFTRGWTLQELVASKKVELYAKDGYLGSREDLLSALKNITGINLGEPLPDHATRLSWVDKRITKRPEDKAYCMLGICDVSLDARYGEGGDSAWQRLLDAISYRHGTIALQFRGAGTIPDHRKTVLEALRFKALETRRKTVKVALAKTCKWILSHPACAKWLKLEHKFFWIKGKPGAGKSVLIKYLDQHVTRRLKKSDAVGLYFYFNARGTQLEKSFLGLYRSLLVQLIDLVPELAHELDALDTSFDLTQLQDVLTSAIFGLDRQIWLFIDALDECREGDVLELIDFLDGLQEAKLYVCFASRHYPIYKMPTRLQLVLEEVDEHRQDLSTYVEKLDLEGEELAQMQHDIVAKSNGIFLWVVLVVKILQDDVKRARFHAMQSRLREIPAGLPDLFKTIILRDDKHKDEFLLCLRWILYASRPLSLREWYFAMMAGIGGRLKWTKGVTDHRMETFLLSSSKGLAELTKGKMITAQFIHESVRSFLIDQGGFEEICDNRETLRSTVHEDLKQCCLRGMAFDLPRQLKQLPSKKQLLTDEECSSLMAQYPFAEYATTYILHHANEAAVEVCQQDFFTNGFAFVDWRDRFNAFQKQKINVYSGIPSLCYLCAERNRARLLTRPTTPLLPETKQRYQSPLIAAITQSSWDVLEAFLNDMNVPNVQETIAEVATISKWKVSSRAMLNDKAVWAVGHGLEHLSRYLLRSESKGKTDSQFYSRALLLASIRGDHHVVQMLIEEGVHVTRDDGPLVAASAGGHEKVVQMMIDLGADIKNSFAIRHASYNGQERVVQMLINAGADVNNTEIGTALALASEGGHERVVQMLIDAGADVNAQGGQLGNALQAASAMGHETVVQMLIDAGVDVNAKGGQYGTALQAASVNKRERVVQMLLDAGVVSVLREDIVVSG